jgi:hypothetical protein
MRKLFFLLLNLVVFNYTFAYKVKVYGSGGVVIQSNGDTKICPNSGDELCATLHTDSFWEWLVLWWKYGFISNETHFPLETNMDVVNEDGSSSNYRISILSIDRSVPSYVGDSEIKTTTGALKIRIINQ